MMLHLEAISDEMIEAIKNNSIVIQQAKIVIDVSDGRDEDSARRTSTSETSTSGRATSQIALEEKPRYLRTSEDSKRNRLDGQARNIIIRSTPDHIQCKLWCAKMAKEAWKLVEQICVGSQKTKENKFEILKLKFQNFKQGPSETLEQLNFQFAMLISEMAALGESERYSNAEKVKTIVRFLNHN